MYVATRGLYSLKPPTIFVPPCIKADVEKLFEVHRSMSKDELKHELVALDVGMNAVFFISNFPSRVFLCSWHLSYCRGDL